MRLAIGRLLALLVALAIVVALAEAAARMFDDPPNYRRPHAGARLPRDRL